MGRGKNENVKKNVLVLMDGGTYGILELFFQDKRHIEFKFKG